VALSSSGEKFFAKDGLVEAVKLRVRKERVGKLTCWRAVCGLDREFKADAASSTLERAITGSLDFDP
jgi:hypothetical protein